MMIGMIELKSLEEIREAVSAASIHLDNERIAKAAFVLGTCWQALDTLIGTDDDDARDQIG